ncbi:MAG TPA: phosphatase PAP2 family protein [Actinomycetota bacterium]|nr:phosphatase PAP2 family protein [Actinomycetota bacterium]
MSVRVPPSLKRRLDPEHRFGLRVTLFALAAVLVFVPFGLLLDHVVDGGPLTARDRALATDLHDQMREDPRWVPVFRVLSFLGLPAWLWVVVGSVSVRLWLRGRRRLVAYLATTGLFGAGIELAVKYLVARPRPVLEDPFATAHGRSFPSGHAFNSTVVYGMLLLVFFPVIARRVRPWLVGAYLLLVAGVCLSRLALGVHFLTDVVGGFVLGVAWLAASTAAFSIWRTERGAPPVDASEGVEPESALDLRAHRTAPSWRGDSNP